APAHTAWATTFRQITLPRISTKSSIRTLEFSMIWLSFRPAPHRQSCAACWAVFSFRPTRFSSALASSQAVSAIVTLCCGCYFIDKLATRVFEIGDGRVEVYPGNYEDYRWRKGGGAARLQEAVAAAPAAVQPVNGNGAAPAESKSKRLNPIKRKQMEDRVRELEHEITRMEAAIAECESALQTFVSADETQRLTQELEKHKRSLQAKVQEWEELGQ